MNHSHFVSTVQLAIHIDCDDMITSEGGHGYLKVFRGIEPVSAFWRVGRLVSLRGLMNSSVGLSESDEGTRCYYSLKLFPRFWLENIVICEKWRQVCSKNCQIIEKLTKKTWGRSCESKKGGIFHSLHEEEIGELLANWEETHSKNSKKTTRRTTSTIWEIFAELNNPLSPKRDDKHALSKMNLTSMEVSMF